MKSNIGTKTHWKHALSKVNNVNKLAGQDKKKVSKVPMVMICNLN